MSAPPFAPHGDDEGLGRDHGPAFGAVLSLASACSPYLRQLLRADQPRLDRLASRSPELSLRELVARQRAVHHRFVSEDVTRDEAMSELRRAKQEQALLVALADLGGAWSVDEVVEALTEFADASVESATAIALIEAERAGLFRPDRSDMPLGRGLVVLALGKHGARELNYSSDIDLIVFFDPAAGRVRDEAATARVYTRLAQSIARLLQDRTVDGYVHRVDYRLRPDPASTPPAVSLRAAYTYYETLGQNWERAAMIKARPVAGDLDLGARFLRDLEPFIWRKYFDFGSIADIHAMKRQIHAVRGHGEIAVAGHDIKVGRGGIREIEFFVQTQQLVFGGRRPELRGRRTLDMLAGLQREGWVSVGAREELSEAYRFLRTVEHRVQMVADEQTQRLPAQPEELARLATFCGYADTDAFAMALLGQARCVQRHYGLLFEEAPALASDLGDLVFAGPDIDPATVETLRQLGFRQAEEAAETVRGWHFGRRPAVTSARAREVLTELVPSLLTALGGSADPDTALSRLDAAFARMPAAVELLTILKANEQLRVLFADLLGSAPRLAETVASAPHVLDAVLGPAFAQPRYDPEVVEDEFRALVGHPRSTEEFLDATRDAVRHMQFSTGARLLSGVLSPEGAGAAYAAIARATVRASLDEVTEIFAREHGPLPGGAMAVLGLGRLGAGDLTADSDLDLVVLYKFDEARRSSTGARPLDAVLYYTRLTQRLVSALTAPTRRGRLYDVDLRLRPSGTKGPIAVQFSGFAAYQAGDAELWEHMALSRSRVVAGDPDFGSEVTSAIRDILRRPRVPTSVFTAVAGMRDLVAREKGDAGQWDVKLGPGGIMDLDFLAQALVLAHAGRVPELLGLGTAGVLGEAGRQGLLAASLAEDLAGHFHRLDGLLHWQRLAIPDEQRKAPSAAMLRRLAGLAGAPDEQELEAQVTESRRTVRAAFDRILRNGSKA